MKAQILSHLPENFPWRDTLLWFDCIDSTNTQAKVLAEAGVPHGTVLIADSQSGGRGRWGRTFQSPAGMGVYLSVILRPDCRGQDLMHLTCAAAVAMCQAVEAATGVCPGIKWTNDLVFEKQKLGGILTELSLDSRTGLVKYAIIGVGINCAQRRSDFPPELQDIATSLSLICGKTIDRSRLTAEMMRSFCKLSDVLLTEKTMLMDSYRRSCVTLGQEICLQRGDEVRRGTALDVDADGGLLVRFADDGIIQTVTSGEVSVRGMYGYL